MAAGHGFADIDFGPVPAVEAFLSQARPNLDASEIPTDLPTRTANPFQFAHRYLLATVAVVWRLTGYSWDGVRALLALGLGMSAALLYGVFRVGMSRPVSLFGAALSASTPLTLATLPSIRDFAKAPFILALLWMMGWLVKRPRSTPSLLAGSAAMGLLLGLGLGFRQDLLVFLLPAMAVVVASPRGPGRLWVRSGAVVLLLGCFVIPAGPILRSGGHAAFHHITIGLGTPCDDAMGLGRASYERVCQSGDLFAFATQTSHGYRVNGVSETIGFASRESESAGRCFVLAVARTFPGDMITRGYGAVQRILRDWRVRLGPAPRPEGALVARAGAIHLPLAVHLERYGVWYALGALVLMSLIRVGWACWALFFLLYFCAYVNLEYEYRHVFHLGFVPIWFMGFLVNGVLSGLAWAGRKEGRHRLAACFGLGAGWWRAQGRRAVVFCIGMPLLLGGVLHGARVWQAVNVKALAERYETADLEPMPTESSQQAEWTSFALNEPLSAPPGTEGLRYETHYVVVDLGPFEEDLPIRIEYEACATCSGFSQVCDVAANEDTARNGARYFFVVYETEHSPMRSVFRGIAVPSDRSAVFQGMLRVRNLGDFPLLPNAAFLPGRGLVRPCQRLLREPEVIVRAAVNAGRLGNEEGEIDALRMGLRLTPGDASSAERLGRALRAGGDRRRIAGDARGALVWYTEAAETFKAAGCETSDTPVMPDPEDRLEGESERSSVSEGTPHAGSS